MLTLEDKTENRRGTQTDLCFDHLRHLVTDIGIWQHTAGDDPNPRHGYSIDDVARAMIVGLRYWQAGVETSFNVRLAKTCFEFIRAAALSRGEETGLYHNFCDADGNWLDSIGSEDSFGRTLWGLGAAHAVGAPFVPRPAIERLIQRSLPHIDELMPLRSKAFSVLGLAYSRQDDKRLRHLADELADAYDRTADSDWHWFEDGMTYCNARLPHALFVAAGLFPQETRYARIAAESLEFLLQATRNDKGGYSPIGNEHLTTRWWFRRGEAHPPLFDQQPVDAGVMVEACAEAYRVTGEPHFRQAAYDAYAWYFGANVHGVPVYHAETGGVADAINRFGISRNQGAESVLSIHLAALALRSMP